MPNNEMIATVKSAGNFCRYDRREIAQFSPKMLSPDYWQQAMAVTGSAQGRGTTWFVKYKDNPCAEEKHWVLRHYYRGGLIGKLINDSYWFTGYCKTRAAQEFSLLTQMQQLALPAPKPIAYRVRRCGLFYRADLLSSRIEQAQDLVAILAEQSLEDHLWEKIGATIKRFHTHNIYHHDLNAHNILLNAQQEVFLIDFDRGEIRTSKQASWQAANMARLQRSFLKELAQLPQFHFSEHHWNTLQAAYNK